MKIRSIKKLIRILWSIHSWSEEEINRLYAKLPEQIPPSGTIDYLLYQNAKAIQKEWMEKSLKPSPWLKLYEPKQ